MDRSAADVLAAVARSCGESFDGGVTSVHSARAGGDTALHIVAKWGDGDAVEILVTAGADLNKAGEDENTPLHYAAMLGHVDAAKRLVALGAKCSMDRHGNTPSMLASNSPDLRRYLEGHGF